MVVEYIRYRIPVDRGDAFEAAYAAGAESLRDSASCLAYELSRCVEEPGSYVMRIEWDSLEGHLQGFRKSREFQPFFAAVRPFFDQIEEMNHYERTAVATP